MDRPRAVRSSLTKNDERLRMHTLSRKSVLGLSVAVAVAAAGVLAIDAGHRSFAADADAPSSLVEDFSYPGAAALLTTRGIKLVSGDGHIMLADCGADPDLPPVDLLLVQTNDLTLPGNPNFCFKTSGTHGQLSLEVSQVYFIRGNNKATVDAKVSVEPASGTGDPVVKTEAVTPGEWQPVGIGNSEGEATLLELRF
jgi:hypothetical protein